MRLRRPVNDTPAAIRAGVLFGIWCGLMAVLMGCLHLDHLLQPSARFACWAVGLVGMVGSVGVAELCRARGGRWAPEGWIGGVFLAAFLFVPLLLLEFAAKRAEAEAASEVTFSTRTATTEEGDRG